MAHIPRFGEQAPWFRARTASNPRYSFDTVAGRVNVLCFYGSAGDDYSKRVLAGMQARRALFDDVSACFFGVSVDPADEASERLHDQLPGIRHFRDFDGAVARAYGLLEGNRFQRVTFVLDARLRVHSVIPFTQAAEAHVQAVLAAVDALLREMQSLSIPAPVLVIPRVFEPALCRRLIDYYNAGGAYDSGFMREVDGKTVGVYDYGHKRRSDKDIDDEQLRQTCMLRIHDRVAPEILRAFQFRATRIERHIVACYDAQSGGHFRAHRDNTTPGTAHRRFAVSVVLNTGEFEGGELRFAEFGQQTYAPPAGGAVVFSCSLLHEATPVTAGLRYTYLPFLYDDAAAQVRQQNAGTITVDERSRQLAGEQPGDAGVTMNT